MDDLELVNHRIPEFNNWLNTIGLSVATLAVVGKCVWGVSTNHLSDEYLDGWLMPDKGNGSCCVDCGRRFASCECDIDPDDQGLINDLMQNGAWED